MQLGLSGRTAMAEEVVVAHLGAAPLVLPGLALLVWTSDRASLTGAGDGRTVVTHARVGRPDRRRRPPPRPSPAPESP